MLNRQRPTGRGAAAARAALLTLALLAHGAAGQGLVGGDNEDVLQASRTPYTSQLGNVWRTGVAFNRAFVSSAGAKKPCGGGKPEGESLCAAAAAGDGAAAAALALAAAPAEFDGRTWPYGPRRFGPVFDQGDCGLCVAGAVAAAADAAMASALGVAAAEVATSPGYLYYCAPSSSDASCASGMTLIDALNDKRHLSEGRGLPGASCAPTCGRRLFGSDCRDACFSAPCVAPRPAKARSVMRYRRLGDYVEAQDHIRRHGAVVTSMRLYYSKRDPAVPHLREWYEARAATDVYNSLEGADLDNSVDHAVTLIGYDNTRAAWLVRNSWGPGFADGGHFLCAFNVSRIAPPDRLYGLRFYPTPPLPAPPLPTAPVPGRPGCVRYTTRPGDYLQSVAAHAFDIPVDRLIEDNAAVITWPPGALILPGTKLLVCGATVTPQAAGSRADLDAAFASPSPPYGSFPARLELESKFRASANHAAMFSSLDAFDGRALALQFGPISRVCTWTARATWIHAINITYGYEGGPSGAFTDARGNHSAFRGVEPECLTLDAAGGEALTAAAAQWGLFVDWIMLGTSRRLSSAEVLAGGKSEGGTYRDNGRVFGAYKHGFSPSLALPPGGRSHLAAISGWVGVWFYEDGSSYKCLAGLQFHWSR